MARNREQSGRRGTGESCSRRFERDKCKGACDDAYSILDSKFILIYYTAVEILC